MNASLLAWTPGDRFDAPWLLWTLLLVPAALGAYVFLQRRRPKYAVRFTNLDLLASVVDRKPLWRRHVPAVLFLLGLTTLLVAVARPQAIRRVPKEEATIILVIDVSGSMVAKDVSPNRLAAAKAAAKSFAQGLPPKVQLGLVSFSRDVRVMATPTTDRQAVIEAIGRLDAAGGTAMGDGLLTALSIVRPDEVELGAPAGAEGTTPATKPGLDGEKAGPAVRIPATVLLLSDGKNSAGTTLPLQAAAVAKAVGVPVNTIALGTAEGIAELPGEDGQTRYVQVPPDPETLAAIADETGGRFYEAPSSSSLEQVYDDLGSKLGYTNIRRDVTDWPVGIAAVLLVLCGAFSLLWERKLP